MSAAAGAGSPAGYPFLHAPATRSQLLHRGLRRGQRVVHGDARNRPRRTGLRGVGRRLSGAKVTVMGPACRKSSDPREAPVIPGAGVFLPADRDRGGSLRGW